MVTFKHRVSAGSWVPFRVEKFPTSQGSEEMNLTMGSIAGEELPRRCTYFVRLPVPDAADIVQGSFRAYYPPSASETSTIDQITAATATPPKAPACSTTQQITRPDGVKITIVRHCATTASLLLPPPVEKKRKEPPRPILHYVPPTPLQYSEDLMTRAKSASYHISLGPKAVERRQIMPPPEFPAQTEAYYHHGRPPLPYQHHHWHTPPRPPLAREYHTYDQPPTRPYPPTHGFASKRPSTSRHDLITDSTTAAPHEAGNAADENPLKQRKRYKKRDKGAPKRPLCAYNLFFKDQRIILKKERNQDQGDDRIGFESLAKIIGNRWKQIDEATLKKYQERAAKNREQYQIATAEYRRKKQQEIPNEGASTNLSLTRKKDGAAEATTAEADEENDLLQAQGEEDEEMESDEEADVNQEDGGEGAENGKFEEQRRPSTKKVADTVQIAPMAEIDFIYIQTRDERNEQDPLEKEEAEDVSKPDKVCKVEGQGKEGVDGEEHEEDIVL